MLSAERRNLILEQLRRDERVLVSELVKQYQVSDETIRRDLLKLEQEGLAMRSYGGAVLAEEGRTALPYKVRKKTRVEEKRIIAALTAELIDDSDFIMLDESSTALYVAKSLKHKKISRWSPTLWRSYWTWPTWRTGTSSAPAVP